MGLEFEGRKLEDLDFGQKVVPFSLFIRPAKNLLVFVEVCIMSNMWWVSITWID